MTVATPVHRGEREIIAQELSFARYGRGRSDGSYLHRCKLTAPASMTISMWSASTLRKT